MKITTAHRDAFRDLTVAAGNHCTDIISLSHALYYYRDGFSRNRVDRMLSGMREAMDALSKKLEAVEALFAPTSVMNDMSHEEVILQEFLHGGLRYRDATQRLEALGYEPKDAERMVDEWADGAEEDDRDRYEYETGVQS